ncbi:unnamed protein product [Cochlearia groenlandica]
MEDHNRKKPYGDMQIQPYKGGGHGGFRNYSDYYNKATKEKGKASTERSKTWGRIKDPEIQRKKRVASYKMYGVQGKVKGSFTKSFRWLKHRYTNVVYGWW